MSRAIRDTYTRKSSILLKNITRVFILRKIKRVIQCGLDNGHKSTGSPSWHVLIQNSDSKNPIPVEQKSEGSFGEE